MNNKALFCTKKATWMPYFFDLLKITNPVQPTISAFPKLPISMLSSDFSSSEFLVKIKKAKIPTRAPKNAFRKRLIEF